MKWAITMSIYYERKKDWTQGSVALHETYSCTYIEVRSHKQTKIRWSKVIWILITRVSSQDGRQRQILKAVFVMSYSTFLLSLSNCYKHSSSFSFGRSYLAWRVSKANRRDAAASARLQGANWVPGLEGGRFLLTFSIFGLMGDGVEK